MSEPHLISRQQLIRTFGFSATLIEELGRPDYVRANRGWGFTYFYDLARVEIFAEEHADRLNRILLARPRRQESAQATSRRRSEEMVNWSQTVPLLLEPIPPHALENARRYFAPETLTRERTLLYLRLHHSNYLECVAHIPHQRGAQEARIVLRERVNRLLSISLEEQGCSLSLESQQTRLECCTEF